MNSPGWQKQFTIKNPSINDVRKKNFCWCSCSSGWYAIYTTAKKPIPGVSAARISAPDNVETILEKACNDCHSNNTVYPWYANIQPVGWWLNHHINEGKNGMNLDEFETYSLRKKYHKLEEIAELVHEGEMPLSSYTWIHKDAILTEEEKGLLVDWSTYLKNQMESVYPKDSLTRPKR